MATRKRPTLATLQVARVDGHYHPTGRLAALGVGDPLSLGGPLNIRKELIFARRQDLLGTFSLCTHGPDFATVVWGASSEGNPRAVGRNSLGHGVIEQLAWILSHYRNRPCTRAAARLDEVGSNCVPSGNQPATFQVAPEAEPGGHERVRASAVPSTLR